MNNGLNEDKAKSFLKEFAKLSISGGTLHAINHNNNVNKFKEFRQEFSETNQAYGIWMVVQACIENIGKDQH